MGHIEGWLSKYEVEAEEKLPADSELLQQLLDLLTCREHRTASWAAKWEKEYYYQAQRQIAVSNSSERQLMAGRQGKITQAGFDQLTEEAQPDKPALALEDEIMVKREPEEEEQDTQTAQAYKHTQSNLKKLSKQMGDLAHEALVYNTTLQKRVDQGKIYLQPHPGTADATSGHLPRGHQHCHWP